MVSITGVILRALVELSSAVFDDKLGRAKQYALGLFAAAYGRRFADPHSDRFEPKQQSG
jgi:hypothetical protein